MEHNAQHRTQGVRVRRKLAAVLAAAAVALTAAVGGVIAQSAPALAATHGPGGNWNQNGDFIGAYVQPDGSLVYCADSEVNFQDFEASGGIVSAITPHGTGDGTRNVSGDDLKKINYAISTHGQTSDSITAAATQAYVWTMTNDAGHDGFYYLGNAPQAAKDAYVAIANDTAANFNAGGGGAGTVDLWFDVDPSNNYLGVLTVTNMSPSNATGTIALTNGVFADTGLPIRDGVTNNSSLPVVGVPPEDAVVYKIFAEGAFMGSGAPAFDANVTQYGSVPSGWQRGVGPGTSTPGVTNFTASAEDPSFRSTIFQPVVGTQVASKFVAEGEEFSDLLRFDTAADDMGLNNPWRTNAAGRYMPLTAQGTLYGPFLAQPVEADDVPENAHIAATGITVTTTAEEGPTIEYTADSGLLSQEAGFYTWVWEIRQSDQSAAGPNVQQFLPADYHFKDRFGQVVETSITPTNLAITTQLTEGVIGIGQDVADEVTVASFGGGWIQADGGRVPATLTGTAYYSETEPVLADDAPVGAEVVDTVSLTVNRNGSVTSDSVTMPIKEGYVTFQWCLIEANQPAEYQGMLAEVCDAYGQASETVQVIAPTVTTEAKQIATKHDAIFDTAIVDGPVPNDTVVSFELFKKPVAGDFKRDSGGNVSSDQWTAAEVAALGSDAVCTVENRVTQTAGVAVAPGENTASRYDSPEVFVDDEGTYWWIESLVHVPSDTVIRVGECGLSNETTIVEEPSVTTKATQDVFVGEKAHDTATVTGPIPGADSGVVTELTFEAFEKNGANAVCTDSNRVHNLDDPIVVNGAGDYASAEVTFEKAGTYYWVETLAYVFENGDREIVHQGECGLPDETTKVTDRPALALTGMTGALTPFGWGAGIGVALLATAGVVLFVARRRAHIMAEASMDSVE